MANAICAQILLLAAEDPDKDIYLYINSPGGSVSARHGHLRHDAVREERRRHRRHGPGRLDGPVPAVRGGHGQAVRTPHARIMMHQPSGGLGGTASDIKIQAEHMLYTKKTMAERIAFHTGQSWRRSDADSDRDRWFTAEEARDYGFVDHVVRSASRSPVRGTGMSPTMLRANPVSRNRDRIQQPDVRYTIP